MVATLAVKGTSRYHNLVRSGFGKVFLYARSPMNTLHNKYHVALADTCTFTRGHVFLVPRLLFLDAHHF